MICNPNGEAERTWIKPGEMALLLASGTIHRLDPIIEGEKVTILTIGIQKMLKFKEKR